MLRCKSFMVVFGKRPLPQPLTTITNVLRESKQVVDITDTFIVISFESNFKESE